MNATGSGSEQYPPEMMVMLLVYCYATGRVSSRVIEEATYTDISSTSNICSSFFRVLRVGLALLGFSSFW
ncbi:MAG: transposase [Treponema sp.]|nr:transposase [Treponema sp.]